MGEPSTAVLVDIPEPIKVDVGDFDRQMTELVRQVSEIAAHLGNIREALCDIRDHLIGDKS